MTGFRVVTVDDVDVLVNDGPADAATGTITGDSAAALWTRQVLIDGRLRAVVLNLDDDADFVAVHRTAERIAAVLQISAVDVAVWPAHKVVVTTAADADPALLPAADTVLLASGTDPSAAEIRTVSTFTDSPAGTP